MASAKWLKNLIARILSLLYWVINIMCLALYISISFAFGIKIENSKTSLFHNTFYTGALYHIGRKMTERKFNNCNWLKTLNLINAGWTQESDLASSPKQLPTFKINSQSFYGIQTQYTAAQSSMTYLFCIKFWWAFDIKYSLVFNFDNSNTIFNQNRSVLMDHLDDMGNSLHRNIPLQV